jgi:hypothetical protein
MSSRVARESKLNVTGNFLGGVFGPHDLCRLFANPIRLPKRKVVAEA